MCTIPSRGDGIKFHYLLLICSTSTPRRDRQGKDITLARPHVKRNENKAIKFAFPFPVPSTAASAFVPAHSLWQQLLTPAIPPFAGGAPAIPKKQGELMDAHRAYRVVTTVRRGGRRE